MTFSHTHVMSCLFLTSLSGLPVVVENFPGFRRLGLLCSHLRCLLFCQQGENLFQTQVLSNSSVAKYELYFKLFTTDAPAVKYSTLILTGDNNCVSCSPAGHCRVHPLPSLLWLHHPDGAVILAADGHDWLLRSLHVHQKNLRCRKDWLSRPVAALLIIIIFFLWSLFYCLFFPFFIYIFLFVVSNKHWLVCRKQKEFLRCCSPSHWTHEGE